MYDHSQPENKDAETLGNALFEESAKEWDTVFQINGFSPFFVTAAFLGLLDKGAREKPGTMSSVINITSVSGELRIAQDHVRTELCPLRPSVPVLTVHFSSPIIRPRQLLHR